MHRSCNIGLIALVAILPLELFAGTASAIAGGDGRDLGFYKSESRPYSFEFSNLSLDRALFIISGRTGAEFIYEPHITQGITVTSVFREQELRAILNELLGEFGLEARRIRTGVFVIRYSMRNSLPLYPFPKVNVDLLARRHVHAGQVASTVTEQKLPLRDVIRNLVLP